MPALAELLPHKPPMRLVDAITSIDGGAIVCRATITEDTPFVAGGEVSNLLALELFAQTAATLCAARAYGRGQAMRVGVLLGVRELTLEAPTLAVGDVLEVDVRERWSDARVGNFRCQLRRDGVVLASGAINVQSGAPEQQEERA
ncbi:MAG: hypothetical protein KC636_04330 [Myxococcales bacterium]|nr:hypothetical protein [Myxococcales bacterium]